MKFAKLASNLHTNPKVFTAGRNAREIYIWALCKNAELEADGTVPGSYFEPEFASRMLGCDARDVTDGLMRAERAGLIRRVADGSVTLVGWDEEWRPSVDGKTRTRRWREAKKAQSQESPSQPVTNGDARDVTESHGDGCDVGEESRGEKKREREPASRPPPRDAFKHLADQLWKEQEELRAALKAEGIDPGSGGLGPIHPAKNELVRRISECAEQGGIEGAASACRHVLAVLGAEARGKRTLRWLDGNHWEPKRFGQAQARSVESATPSRKRDPLMAALDAANGRSAL